MNTLTDLKVIDLTRALSGPYATMMLADMGADVIKVEEPIGDMWRYSYTEDFQGPRGPDHVALCPFGMYLGHGATGRDDKRPNQAHTDPVPSNAAMFSPETNVGE
jgi:hypothetical protein